MKLQTKILVISFALAVLLGAPVLWTLNSAVHDILIQDVEKHTFLNVQDLAEEAGMLAGFQSRSEQQLLPHLQAAQERVAASFVVALDPQGEVIAHTNVSEKGKRYDDALTRRALRSDGPVAQVETVKREPTLTVYAPVWSAAKNVSSEEFLLGGNSESAAKARIGTIELGMPLQEVLNTQNRLFQKIAGIVSGAVCVALLSIALFIRRLLQPIKLLSEGTARIGRGDYCVLIPVLSKDELGGLAADFNRMSKTLAETTVSKNFLGDVLSHMVDPLIVMGMDTKIQMVNQATADLLGYDRSELEGHMMQMLFLGKDRESPPIEETLIKGSVRNLELEFVAKSGAKFPVLFSSSLLKSDNQESTGIIAVAKDMTERKRLEGMVRQSDKMSAVGQLAAGVAHEINNPLGVILGFAQAVVRRLQPADPLEMPLKSIEKEAVRCRNLVQDLLTFSRTSKIDREPVDINRAVDGAFSLVIAQARMTHVQVRKELAADLPRVFGNLNQIQQVVINLASNAMDAIGERTGELVVKTQTFEEGPLSWVCLKVIDNGPGMPADVLPRIFDPFFTTKAIGKGTGLGLSLVHEIIKKHSGTIDVNSRPGRTEFRICFPVRPITPAPASASGSAHP